MSDTVDIKKENYFHMLVWLLMYISVYLFF